MTRSGIVYVCLIATVCFLAFANWIDALRPDPCCDWMVRRGFPFAILVRGGYQGMFKHLWPGIFGNLIVALLTGLLIGLGCQSFLAKRAR